MDTGGADWQQQELEEYMHWHETQQQAQEKEMEMLKIEGFILKNQYGSFSHARFEMPEFGYMTVCPHTIEVPMPAGFNPIDAEVSMLQQKLAKETEEHAHRVKAINDRIANLLCIEYTPTVEAEPVLTGEIPF